MIFSVLSTLLKEEVLTSRIAYLILRHSIPPSAICAVTFTNKAANEMKQRLIKMIGKEQASELKMGTFHALCVLFLRMNAKLVALKNNFTICDADESDSTVVSMIAKAKSKGETPEEMKSATESKKKDVPRDQVSLIVADIYREYQRTLKKNNCLDFDDLLVYGVKLFKKHPKVVSWCCHILVDEYQDTNTMQYELMRSIAGRHHCATIVGDPDQSIYGWRSADVTNLQNMQRDFPATSQILLEENYRSTGSILAISSAIVSEDKSRIPKSLRTSHPDGTRPTLHSFLTEEIQASFMALEIKRLVASSGGMLGCNDFAILLRFNALSRVIETALRRESIPHKILGGQKFFERQEIKDLLAYLQVIDNSLYTPAFMRIINVPPRGVGEKSVAEILSRAEQIKSSPLDVVERIFDSKIPDIKPPLKHLLRHLLDLICYEDYLRKTQPDWESRWENVQELINFASQEQENTNIEVSLSVSLSQEAENGELESEGVVIVEGDRTVTEEDRASDVSKYGGGPFNGFVLTLCIFRETPLRLFLQASMLSTDAETKEDGAKEIQRVTISTCHAAKGLEWPVVMVPADTSHSTLQTTANLLSAHTPGLSVAEFTDIARVLGRHLPEKVEIDKRRVEFAQTGLRLRWLTLLGIDPLQAGSVIEPVPGRAKLPAQFTSLRGFEQPSLVHVDIGALYEQRRPLKISYQSHSRAHPPVPTIPPYPVKREETLSRPNFASSSKLPPMGKRSENIIPARAIPPHLVEREEPSSMPYLGSGSGILPIDQKSENTAPNRAIPPLSVKLERPSSSSLPCFSSGNKHSLIGKRWDDNALTKLNGQTTWPQPAASSSSEPDPPEPSAAAKPTSAPVTGVKRRLGMGRTTFVTDTPTTAEVPKRCPWPHLSPIPSAPLVAPTYLICDCSVCFIVEGCCIYELPQVAPGSAKPPATILNSTFKELITMMLYSGMSPDLHRSFKRITCYHPASEVLPASWFASIAPDSRIFPTGHGPISDGPSANGLKAPLSYSVSVSDLESTSTGAGGFCLPYTCLGHTATSTMPAGSDDAAADDDDYFRSWEAFDRVFTTQPVSPGNPNDIQTRFPETSDRPMAPEPFSTPHYSQASTSSAGPSTPADSDSLDRVWSEVMRKKERAMAVSPSKIKSLEVLSASDQLSQAAPASPPITVKPRLKRQKSNVTFKESSDGRRVVAVFDLPGVKKQEMHVSYQVDRLVVTWQTIKVTERMEGGTLLRDREQKKYSRTILLPEGTKHLFCVGQFEEVHASRDHQRLMLTYPNMRACMRYIATAKENVGSTVAPATSEQSGYK
ncbi:hypothetical protein EW146_g4817 [Bondarzewia mesenterica]|uniref:DNA 3'-5' helicase n=1 Tax=Bondarzewia mesenterica TaxID=1095465 RepID=A0A4S4LV77_9AGAM|nr:hypothetical protein EW146_g4817 [Bondarzewia mesenterica]